MQPAMEEAISILRAIVIKTKAELDTLTGGNPKHPLANYVAAMQANLGDALNRTREFAQPLPPGVPTVTLPDAKCWTCLDTGVFLGAPCLGCKRQPEPATPESNKPDHDYGGHDMDDIGSIDEDAERQ
jgi:hypothetical protein